jgi:hypothetical protein
MIGAAQRSQQKTPTRPYNTAKQKLTEGKQLVGPTILTSDPQWAARPSWDHSAMVRVLEWLAYYEVAVKEQK